MHYIDDGDDDCRLVECSVSMYKSCSWPRETQQKEKRPNGDRKINKIKLGGVTRFTFHQKPLAEYESLIAGLFCAGRAGNRVCRIL